MCVILVCEEKRPSEEMVARAWGHNSEGGGVAWIEGKGAKAEVHWKKGLDESEMQDFCKTLPTPFIAHFRIASSGSKHPTLCHPFPCTTDAPTELSGKLKGAVMFHNGTWNQWKDYGLKASITANVVIPDGLWNDTRAMAWMAGIYGVNVLEFINEKAAVISTVGAELFGDGWSEEEGIWISNRFFLNSGKGWTHGGYSGTNSGGKVDIQITDKRHTASPGGVLASEVPFRGSSETLLPGPDDKESVQEGVEAVSANDGEGREAEQVVITEVRSVLPLEVAAERLRRLRSEGNSETLVVLGPAAPSGSGLWKTPQEAVAEARREREKRLDAARRNITFLGEM